MSYDSFYDQKAIERWTRTPAERHQNLNIFDAYSRIYVPINIGNYHWVLAIMYLDLKKVVFLDPLRSTKEAPEIFLLLIYWMTRQLESFQEWKQQNPTFLDDWTFDW